MRFSCFLDCAGVSGKYVHFYHFLCHLGWVLHKHYICSGIRVFLVCVGFNGFSPVLQFMYYIDTKIVI